MTQEQETAMYDQPDETPSFAEDEETAETVFYTVELPLDLKNSAHVELVFEPDGTVSRTIDGVAIGTWV